MRHLGLSDMDLEPAEAAAPGHYQVSLFVACLVFASAESNKKNAALPRLI